MRQHKVDLPELLAELTPPVLAAGELIMAIHERGVQSRVKADGSPVSEADEAAEAVLLEALHTVAPDIPVVSEENAASHLAAPSSIFSSSIRLTAHASSSAPMAMGPSP